ncbi:hypothetical protein B0H21DRAFT_885410 [Amylocystis lapponica]|nr:hypothetical protein B0H21DRAFT_885410 [Amylocystis lapponica]
MLEHLGVSSASSDPPWFFVSPYHKNGSVVMYPKGLLRIEVVDLFTPGLTCTDSGIYGVHSGAAGHRNWKMGENSQVGKTPRLTDVNARTVLEHFMCTHPPPSRPLTTHHKVDVVNTLLAMLLALASVNKRPMFGAIFLLNVSHLCTRSARPQTPGAYTGSSSCSGSQGRWPSTCLRIEQPVLHIVLGFSTEPFTVPGRDASETKHSQEDAGARPLASKTATWSLANFSEVDISTATQ